MTAMTSRQFLAVALLVSVLVMWLAPLSVQQVWWAGLLVLVGAGYLARTVFRWTWPRHGLYRRRDRRW